MSYGNPEIAGVAVLARPGEPPARTIRRFGKLVAKCGIKAEMRSHRWYVSRGEARRAKRKRAIRQRQQAPCIQS